MSERRPVETYTLRDPNTGLFAAITKETHEVLDLIRRFPGIYGITITAHFGLSNEGRTESILSSARNKKWVRRFVMPDATFGRYVMNDSGESPSFTDDCETLMRNVPGMTLLQSIAVITDKPLDHYEKESYDASS